MMLDRIVIDKGGTRIVGLGVDELTGQSNRGIPVRLFASVEDAEKWLENRW